MCGRGTTSWARPLDDRSGGVGARAGAVGFEEFLAVGMRGKALAGRDVLQGLVCLDDWDGRFLSLGVSIHSACVALTGAETADFFPRGAPGAKPTEYARSSRAFLLRSIVSDQTGGTRYK